MNRQANKSKPEQDKIVIYDHLYCFFIFKMYLNLFKIALLFYFLVFYIKSSHVH